MKEKLLKEILLIGFIIGALIIFNIVPFISINKVYESYNILEFLSLVIINPIYLVLCGFIYGKQYYFSWFLPMILSLCFVPTMLLFFDASYVFYIFLYIIFIISSELLGTSLERIKQSHM